MNANNILGAGDVGLDGSGHNIKDDRTYIQEIRGTLFSLNDYLSKAQAHYRFVGVAGKPKDGAPFREFYMYLYKLTMDARELIEENNPELLEYLDKWLSGMHWILMKDDPDPEKIWKWFSVGEKLAINLQKTLYMLGIKDSNVSQRVGFPFDIVKRMIELQNDEKNNAKLKNE